MHCFTANNMSSKAHIRQINPFTPLHFILHIWQFVTTHKQVSINDIGNQSLFSFWVMECWSNWWKRLNARPLAHIYIRTCITPHQHLRKYDNGYRLHKQWKVRTHIDSYAECIASQQPLLVENGNTTLTIQQAILCHYSTLHMCHSLPNELLTHSLTKQFSFFSHWHLLDG